jgi:type II secretory pathway pseudopilin PulG
MRTKKAFTMAEAILVMVILGIIATIMISTMRPVEFRDRGFRVLAKKVLGQVDTATTQILFNNSRDMLMSNIYNWGSQTAVFSYASNLTWVKDYYNKYLVGTRDPVKGTWCQTAGATARMKLKDGSCLGFTAAASNSWIPGESTFTAKVTSGVNAEIGAIYLDVNDEEEPNVYGKDQYIIPICATGIAY